MGRQLGNMIPTRPAAAQSQLERVSDATDEKIDHLRKFALHLVRDEGVPMSPQAARQIEGEINQEIERSGIERIKVAGKERYRGEVGAIRRLATDAEEAAKRDDPKAAAALMSEAEAKLGGLIEIIEKQRKLAATGAPEPILKGVEDCFADFGRKTERRARLAMDAADSFIRNHEAADPSRLQSLGQFVSGLGKQAREGIAFTKEDGNAAGRFIESNEKSIRSPTEKLSDESRAQLEKAGDALEKLGPDADPRMGTVLRRLEERVSTILNDGYAEEKGLRELFGAVQFSIRAASGLSGIAPSEEKTGFGNVLIAAAESSASSFNSPEAFLLRFIADEYALSAGKKDTGRTKRLAELSGSLAQARTSAEQASASLWAELDNERREQNVQDPDLSGRLERQFDPAARSVDGLVGARLSVGIAEAAASLGNVPQDARTGAFRLLSLAQDAVVDGFGNAAQTFAVLARTYATSPESRREDIQAGLEPAGFCGHQQDAITVIRAEQPDPAAGCAGERWRGLEGGPRQICIHVRGVLEPRFFQRRGA